MVQTMEGPTEAMARSAAGLEIKGGLSRWRTGRAAVGNVSLLGLRITLLETQCFCT